MIAGVSVSLPVVIVYIQVMHLEYLEILWYGEVLTKLRYDHATNFFM